MIQERRRHIDLGEILRAAPLRNKIVLKRFKFKANFSSSLMGSLAKGFLRKFYRKFEEI